jgi:hypothetical protein
VLDFSFFGDIVRHYSEAVVVDSKQHVDTAFADGESWNVGKEVVADKETQKDKIVDNSFQIIAIGYPCPHKLHMQEFPHQLQIQVLELYIDIIGVNLVGHFLLIFDGGGRPTLGEVVTLAAALRAPFIVGRNDHFPNDVETGLVSSQT